MSIAKFAGSKRKAKILARDERRVQAVKKRLARIYDLSKLVNNEDELNVLLASIPDDATRAATRTIIEPFLLFKLKKVTLASDLDLVDVAAAPEKANRVVLS